MELRTANEMETMQLAEKLGNIVTAGTLITLEGDLGAGKTTFTKGLGKGLGIKRPINSPTFTIMKIYEGGRLPLYHIDAYRLEGLEQDLGFEEFIYGEGVCVIEWYMFIEDLLPEDRLEIKIEYEGEDARKITIIPHGNMYEELVKELG
ncbi:MAG: tRNA (adenosine(37)-N6)-threonylcarbamoyltransferase complex ATPase subunit type 1 TsaE [Erysipelotrichaceae bacterium]|nr:tRNA (adenosine(37)-N6)-threonylcarbamoyltransferase complex ATPase subunit type 1 TsaE [Erysipelotrichaceae bacterium]